MNKETAGQYLPLVQALAEGKTIQLQTPGNGWDDIDETKFNFPPSEYRIKPEPREKWYIQYKGGPESGPYSTKDEAECFALHDHSYRLVGYREVLE